MSYLSDLTNPPVPEADKDSQYQFDNKVYEMLVALGYIMNPSVITNANFATLGSSGTTPITQVDGDGAEFSDDWNVFGASNANYTITPTAYPTGAITSSSPSTISTSSGYYINVAVTSHNGNDFYFYQQQNDTVRKYQTSFLSYGLIIRNNQSVTIKIRMQLFTYFDSASELIQDNSVYLKPGLNKLASLVKTSSLSGKTLGAGNYTQFRLAFIELNSGTADIDIYQIKCEVGKAATLLEQ